MPLLPNCLKPLLIVDIVLLRVAEHVEIIDLAQPGGVRVHELHHLKPLTIVDPALLRVAKHVKIVNLPNPTELGLANSVA